MRSSIILLLTSIYLLISCNQIAESITTSPIETSATKIKDIIEKKLKENRAAAWEDEPVQSDAAERQSDSTHSKIKTVYTRLQKLLEKGKIEKKVKNIDCEDDPWSGQLIRYYENGKLVVLEYTYGGEHFWEDQTVFFKNDKPIFIFEQKGYWSFGGRQDLNNPNTIDKITEKRSYLQGEKIVQLLTKDYELKTWEKS